MDKNTSLIGVSEAAQILGIDTRTVHRRITRGDFESVTKLPGIRAPYVLNRAEVEAKAAA